MCEFVDPYIETTVDDPTTGPAGAFSSIAIGSDGLPVISYQNIAIGVPNDVHLRVAHCGNVDCSGGNTTFTADNPANSIGINTSIAIGSDGLPVIAQFEAGGSLRVTHCGNVTCSSGNIAFGADDPATPVGEEPSIAIGSDGFPVISHHDNAALGLRVTHCGNVTCTAGNVSTTIEHDGGAASVGRYSSIAIGTDGLPVISHQFAGTLRMTHCGNLDCTAGNVSTTVDDAPGHQMAYYTSIAIGVDGLPIISHHDFTSKELRVTHCGNITCTTGNVSTLVDTGSVGEYTSIAIGADGLPIISHRANGRELRVTKCGNVACNAGNISTTIDAPTDAVGLRTSIAIGTDGKPIISHGNETQGALRVTKCKTATCQ